MFTSTTGAIKHSLSWALSGLSDTTLENPNYDADLAAKVNLDGGIALFCVHGTADRWTSFIRVANHLIGRLPRLFSCIKLTAFQERGKGKSIEDFSAQLYKQVLESNHQHVIFLGHSRGGLIAAHCAIKASKQADFNVHGLFSMCAPFQGSPLALWPLTSLSSSVEQMTIESDFLIKLSDDFEDLLDKTNLKAIFYGAAHDSIVPKNLSFPPHCAHLSKIFENHGHLSIMGSKKLTFDILFHLNEMNRTFLSADSVDEITATDNEAHSTLDAVCKELSALIEDLISRPHVKSPLTKIQVLSKLLDILIEMGITNQNSRYPEAKTIGDFISAYLQDENESINRLKPADILNDQLTPIRFFQPKYPRSQDSIEKLIKKYNDVELLSNQSIMTNTDRFNQSLTF